MGDEPEVWGNVLFFENGSLKKLAVFFREQMGIRTNGNLEVVFVTLGP